ncbi:MAG: O-antigen ligase family protein [Oscillospiraceae bacterium]|nr:O-antigen ligase family protein [Oscillospiraceae bacterium]
MPKTTKNLSRILMILMVLQPLMDVLSFFMAQAGMSNLPTLALRMGVLGAAVLYGFLLSDRKKVYLMTGGALAAFWGLHVGCCLAVGYQNPFADFTNYVRVVQIVLYTLCFITFLRQGQGVYQTVLLGICVNLGIIALVMLLSTLTGTDPHTYRGGFGVMGWFSTTNSQASIISACTPVALMFAMLYEGRAKYPLMVLVTAVCDLMLFFNGTRLAFATLLGCAVALPVVMLICRRREWVKFGILLLGAVICVGCVKMSPMYLVRTNYTAAMDEKQGWADTKIQWAEESMAQEEAEEDVSADPDSEVSKEKRERDAIRRLTPVYEWCAENIVDRFGVERVIRKYNFSSDVANITAARQQKIFFCQMLQEDLPVTAKIFGMELGLMTHKGEVYDVENDFYGIYFLYGAVGFVLLLAFVGYFLVMLLRCFVKDPKHFLTPMVGAVCIGLGIDLIYCCFTAGVLRRPNASFYLSVLLALCYYLSVCRTESKAAPVQPNVDGEERV